MKLYERIKGAARVEICGLLPEALLNACAMAAVELWDLEIRDACTLCASVDEGKLSELERLAGQASCELRVLDRRGGSRNLSFLRRRLWLLLAAALLLGLLLFSSLFIWEIRVQGCERLSEGQVLRALEDCGVERGTFWPALSLDLLRSRMLLRLPELSWMTLRLSGSRATVLVSERQEKPEIYLEDRAADIVASRTGVLRRLSVRNGQAKVEPGSMVIAGEILVSGRMESLSHPPRAVRAEAEAIADTWYELSAVRPLPSAEKCGEGSRHRRYALKIGKKRINFYGNGKKMLDGYDKIVHEYSIGLKGLFALPLGLVREELICYAQRPDERDPGAGMRLLLEAYLAERLDGEVVSAQFAHSRGEDRYCVTLLAQCRENIALTIETQETEASP